MRKLTNKKSGIEYQKRIDQALTFIRENLDRPISLSEVASAACFSEFHFHRIFSSLMHETVGQYITRKKLEHAAMRLAYSPSTRVSIVADECGYASVSSFSKSFNQWFGCRPTDIQQIKQRWDSGGGKLQTKYEKSIKANELFVHADDRFSALDENVTVKSIDGFDVVYLTSPDGYDIEGIRNTWVKLNQLVENAGVDWDTCERFSLSHDHPGLSPKEHCRYDALGLAELVRNKEVTPQELLQAALALTEETQGSINAIAHVNAQVGEINITKPASGIFDGVPFLVKELLAYPGLTTAMGSRLFATHVPEDGSGYSHRIDASGLITFGNTTSSEFGLLGSTETLLHGGTRIHC